MTKYFFWCLMLAVCVSALVRGRRDERVAAIVCLVATFFSMAVRSPLAESYSGIEIGVMAVDAGVLAIFVALAVRSQRFWPLWIAGLQLSTIVAHLFKAMDGTLMPRVYAVAERFWSYPILLIILIAALSSPWRYGEIERYRSRFAAH